MQLSLIYYRLGVTMSFCKFWFGNFTLIQVRYFHLLGIWDVFVADMLFSSFFVFFFFFFFDSEHDKIYVDIYLKIFGYILVYTHIKFNNIVIRNVSCSFLLHMKY